MTLNASDPTPNLNAAQLHEIFRHVGEGPLFLLDAGGTVCLHNAKAQDIAPSLREAQDWLGGAHFHDPVEKSRLEPDQAPLARLLDPETTGPFLAAWLDRNGTEHVFSFDSKPLPLDGLRLVSVRELTRRRSSETTLPAASHGDARTSGHLIHGLGNVLGIVQLAGDGLSRLPLPLDAARKVLDILEATTRGNALLRAMDLPDTPESQTEPVAEVIELLNATAAVFERVLPVSMSLDLRLPEAAMHCECARSDLEAVVIEMLGHARRTVATANRSGGIISLKAIADQQNVNIKVDANFGAGAVKAQADRQTWEDPDRPTEDNTNPFSTAESVAAKTNGRFHLEQLGEDGERMILSIPRVWPGANSNALASEKKSRSLEGYRILLCETQVVLSRLLGEQLRDLGAEVQAASSGQEARIALAHGPSPDVMITNYVLSDAMTAESVAEHLTSHHPDTRLIIVSSTPGDLRARQEQPFAMHLPKPVRISVLVNAICLMPPLSGRTAP